MSRRITLVPVRTEEQRSQAMGIRLRVFVEEQGVPVEEEPDHHDEDAHHVLGLADGVPVATGRCYREGAAGRIGRVAVLPGERGAGWGRRVMAALEEELRRGGVEEAVLDAQLHALRFYARLGYRAEGPVFLDAGIEHRRMRKRLLPPDEDGVTAAGGPATVSGGKGEAKS